MPLNEKQEEFCRQYIVDHNATQAAVRAGYSRDSASAIGFENLTKPEIRARVETLQEEANSRTGLSADKVLRELMRIAFCDVRRVFAENRILNINEIDDDTAAAISSIELDKFGNTKKIRTNSKNQALEVLCKHLGLTSEKLRLEMQDAVSRVVLFLPDDGRGSQESSG